LCKRKSGFYETGSSAGQYYRAIGTGRRYEDFIIFDYQDPCGYVKDIAVSLSIVTKTSVTDLLEMPLSELLDIKLRVEKIFKESQKPRR
jgi:hypothetical protein